MIYCRIQSLCGTSPQTTCPVRKGLSPGPGTLEQLNRHENCCRPRVFKNKLLTSHSQQPRPSPPPRPGRLGLGCSSCSPEPPVLIVAVLTVLYTKPCCHLRP